MVTAVTTCTRVILTLSWVAALITPHTAVAFSFTDTLQQVSLAQAVPNLTAHAQTPLLMQLLHKCSSPQPQHTACASVPALRACHCRVLYAIQTGTACHAWGFRPERWLHLVPRWSCTHIQQTCVSSAPSKHGQPHVSDQVHLQCSPMAGTAPSHDHYWRRGGQRSGPPTASLSGPQSGPQSGQLSAT
jgi:hypothetical protein